VATTPNRSGEAPIDELTRQLLAAADGDRGALHGFVRATQADVWRFCAHLVDRAAADDLTQETYVRALASVHRFRGDASARTWLLAVARHTCADEIRRRQRRRPWELLTDQPPDRELPDDSHLSDLEDLVATLDPDRRAAFVLTQLLGLSYAEAAAACEVPVGTIRSRVARARETLLAGLADSRRRSDAG
jgi:RNA polymerase sigma-70 factor (ECF subfamily)